MLAIEVCVQLPAGAEVAAPGSPGLVGLTHAARPIPANEQPITVVGIRGVVPALGLNRHKLLVSRSQDEREKGRLVLPLG